MHPATLRVAAALALLASAAAWATATPKHENLLIVVFDDLGIDKVPAYGIHSRAPKMDTLGALAADGVHFPVAYASPSCSPTRAALLTGRYGRHTGMNTALGSVEEQSFELPLSERLLSEVLVDEGYATGAIGKWHLAGESSPSGFSHPKKQGFGFFVGSIANLGNRFGDYRSWQEIGKRGNLHPVSGDNTAHLADVAIDFLNGAPEPWFLYLAFHAVHEPLMPPPATPGHPALGPDTPEPELYDAVAEHADRQLGRVLASLPPAMRARTNIIALGDNGTPSGAIRAPLDKDRAKLTVFEGGVRVPLIISGPIVASPGRASPALVHVADVLPTIAERAGAALPADLDGRSFLGALRDPANHGPRETVFSQKIQPDGPPPWKVEISTIRDGTWKLTRLRGGGENLYRVGDALDEGADLLDGDLLPKEQDAYQRLSAALDRELAD